MESEKSFRSTWPLFMIGLAVFILLFFPLWTEIACSQNIEVGAEPGLKVSLDKESARVGSIVVLRTLIKLPEGAQLTAEPKIEGLEDITIISQTIKGDEIKIEFLVDQLGSWKSGRLSLSFLDKDGNLQKLEAGSVALTVLSNLGEKPEEAGLKPIIGIIPTHSMWTQYLPWIAGLVGLLFVVLMLLWFRRRRRTKHIAANMDPPHILAKREIKQLESTKLFEKGNFKGYYFRFSEIMRRYLESIRGFPAAEFTVEEISQHVKNEEDRELLPLLQHADLVKFADAVPSPARKEEDINKALSFIEDTSPVDETGNSKENNGGEAQ